MPLSSNGYVSRAYLLREERKKNLVDCSRSRVPFVAYARAQNCRLGVTVRAGARSIGARQPWRRTKPGAYTRFVETRLSDKQKQCNNYVKDTIWVNGSSTAIVARESPSKYPPPPLPHHQLQLVRRVVRTAADRKTIVHTHTHTKCGLSRIRTPDLRPITCGLCARGARISSPSIPLRPVAECARHTSERTTYVYVYVCVRTTRAYKTYVYTPIVCVDNVAVTTYRSRLRPVHLLLRFTLVRKLTRPQLRADII